VVLKNVRRKESILTSSSRAGGSAPPHRPAAEASTYGRKRSLSSASARASQCDTGRSRPITSQLITPGDRGNISRDSLESRARLLTTGMPPSVSEPAATPKFSGAVTLGDGE